MSEQEKKQRRIYRLLNADTKTKFLCLLYIKKIFFFKNMHVCINMFLLLNVNPIKMEIYNR